jgi:predicted DNA-binding protein (MmcQ/YjbR family)
MQPWAEPSGYNLGRAGWVSSSFRPGDEMPVEILRQWIDESYRAVAPRRLVAQLDEASQPKSRQ